MIWLSLVLTITFTLYIYYLVINFYLKLRKVRGKGSLIYFNGNGKHSRLKRVLSIMLIILMGSGINFSIFNISNRLAFFKLDLSGSAKWITTNGQKFLYIEADNAYDLGYHTGNKLSKEIVKMKFLIFISAPSFGLTYSEVESLCKKYLPFIPEKYKEEMLGISEGATAGSGILISFTDVLVQSVFFEVLYGQVVPYSLTIKRTLGCTAFGSINSNGSVIIGQNMDLTKTFEGVQSFVLHKLANNPLVFTYRLGGCPALPMGKNEFGLTIIVNLVQTRVVAPIMIPTFVLIREGLAKENTVEGFNSIISPNNKSSYSRNLIIADENKILAIQSLPENQTINFPTSTIVHSNTFKELHWQDSLIDPIYSKERQIYAENLLETAYNNTELTNAELLDILRDQPEICRNEKGFLGIGTLAFMTTKSFGLGNPNGKIGKIPI